MTREEAKTFLCSIAGDLGFIDIENYTCNDGEKMREAIKALEYCEDCVSREEAFEALNSLNGTSELDKAFEAIERLPSVTPIRRDRTVQGFVDKCRECGREKVLDKIETAIRGKYRVILKDTPKDDWAVRWNECIDEVLEIIGTYKKVEE